MSAMVIDWFFFFFKQKTAYEMRISDWSSDVCSSDLPATAARLYEKLISDDNVDLLFGPWGSASAATAAAVANKHKRVFLNSGGASEQIQERGFKYVFQTAAPISAYVASIGPLAEQYQLKSNPFLGREYADARDM